MVRPTPIIARTVPTPTPTRCPANTKLKTMVMVIFVRSKQFFRKAHAFVNGIGDSLHNAVAGVRHDAHIERHGGADAGQNDGNDEDDYPDSHFTCRALPV